MNNNKLTKDEEAQVGIGTMIVFIATILVAAVAAGVLIDTSQKLQDKSTRTGSDAINNVGTSFTVLNVWGEDGGADGLIDALYIDVSLAAGGSPISMNDLSITYDDGDVLEIYQPNAAGIGSTWVDKEVYIKAEVRDADATSPVMNKDDIFRLGIGVHGVPADGGLAELGAATAVTITLTMPDGTPISVGFTTPNHIDDGAFLRLF